MSERVFKRPGDGAYVRLRQGPEGALFELAFFDDRPHTTAEARLRFGILGEALLDQRRAVPRCTSPTPWCERCHRNHAPGCPCHCAGREDDRCTCQGRPSATREELTAEVLLWRSLAMARAALLRPGLSEGERAQAQGDVDLALEALAVMGYGPDGEELP